MQWLIFLIFFLCKASPAENMVSSIYRNKTIWDGMGWDGRVQSQVGSNFPLVLSLN